MTPQEQLQLAEETLLAMGFKPKPYSSGPEWKKGNQSVFVGSVNPLSNDLAALCEDWILDQGMTYDFFGRKDHFEIGIYRKGECWAFVKLATTKKNEVLCRAVLAVSAGAVKGEGK